MAQPAGRIGVLGGSVDFAGVGFQGNRRVVFATKLPKRVGLVKVLGPKNMGYSP